MATYWATFQGNLRSNVPKSISATRTTKHWAVSLTLGNLFEFGQLFGPHFKKILGQMSLVESMLPKTTKIWTLQLTFGNLFGF